MIFIDYFLKALQNTLETENNSEKFSQFQFERSSISQNIENQSIEKSIGEYQTFSKIIASVYKNETIPSNLSNIKQPQNNIPYKKKNLTNSKSAKFISFDKNLKVDDLVPDPNISKEKEKKSNALSNSSKMTYLTEIPNVKNLNIPVKTPVRLRNKTPNEIKMNGSNNENNTSRNVKSCSSIIDIQKVFSIIPASKFIRKNKDKIAKEAVMTELNKAVSHLEDYQAQYMMDAAINNILISKKLKIYSLKLVIHT